LSNRENIIRCAIDLFFRKGYESVGVQEICDVAGVTKPTLYHYFKSKYGLLKAILEEKYSEFGYKLEAAASSGDDIKSTLHQVAKIYMEYSSANMKVNQLFMELQYSGRESEGNRAVRPYVKRMFNALVGIFNRGSNELGNMYGRQYLFATSFLGAMSTYLLMRYNTTDNEDGFFISQDEIYNVLHQFLHGIYS
jgi:AcrR family transcriptional regulator